MKFPVRLKSHLWGEGGKGVEGVGGASFSYFPKVAINHGVTSDTFSNFCGC